jgi:hypothetical protein
MSCLSAFLLDVAILFTVKYKGFVVYFAFYTTYACCIWFGWEMCAYLPHMWCVFDLCRHMLLVSDFCVGVVSGRYIEQVRALIFVSLCMCVPLLLCEMSAAGSCWRRGRSPPNDPDSRPDARHCSSHHMFQPFPFLPLVLFPSVGDSVCVYS